uniref:PABC domain-containing protein n=1 Tax=Callorhinchus milii TaxID=7868 RepID=V9KYV4_CALMI
MDNTDLSEQLNMLGEKLYNAIVPEHPEKAGKLTGMLLELPVTLLEQMVHDEKLLATALHKAFNALQLLTDKCVSKGEQENMDSDSTDSLGDQLYDLVDIHNTGHSEKITGMLLELGREEVKRLVCDEQLLKQQIDIAWRAVEQVLPDNGPTSEYSEFVDMKESLGEKIFVEVEKIDRQNCANITGMLLEMKASTVQQLLTDRLALQTAVEQAQTALLNSATCVPPGLLTRDDGSEPDSETERLGEELYSYINNTEYSEHSSKITGMLLEMPRDSLTELLKSPEQLNEKIQMAARVLED